MKTFLMFGGLMLATAVAIADEAPPVGADTRAWAELQRSGAAASAEAQPMPGEVADKVYQRYLKSYEQAIPAEFGRERFVSGDAGS